MKRIIVAVAVIMSALIGPCPLSAQSSEDKEEEKHTYLPVLEVGKLWNFRSYVTSNPNMILPDADFGLMVEDVINVDGRDIFLIKSTVPGSPHEQWAYEEDGAIWGYYHNDEEFVPIIDFNLEIGDVLVDMYRIFDRKYVNIEGVERLLVTLVNGPTKYYWCEGIGAIDDCYMTGIVKVMGERVRMTECWLGDKCLFNEHSLDGIAGIEAVDADDRQPNRDVQMTDAPIFDMLGRRISSPAPGQLYIRDGRKYIAP